MNEKKEFDSNFVMEKIKNPDTTYYISPQSKTGFRLEVVDHTIMILGAVGSIRSFTFDNKEDWETFLEKLWNTEHYMAVKKKDFIEFFQALRYLHGHHCRQMDVVVTRQESIQKEITEQQERLDKLKQILSNYEDYYMEVYNESKV